MVRGGDSHVTDHGRLSHPPQTLDEWRIGFYEENPLLLHLCPPPASETFDDLREASAAAGGPVASAMCPSECVIERAEERAITIRQVRGGRGPPLPSGMLSGFWWHAECHAEGVLSGFWWHAEWHADGVLSGFWWHAEWHAEGVPSGFWWRAE